MDPTAATSPFEPARASPGQAPDGLKTARVYEIFLGYACDERCSFCSQEAAWRRAAPPGLPEVARALYLARREGHDWLVLNGGEPTLHRDVLAIIALARRAGFAEIHIQSNGLKLAENGVARALAEAGLTAARLSIHGHLPGVHDALVRVPGALARALRAADLLREAGVAVGINTVITRANAALLPEMYSTFIDRHGLSDFGLIYPLFEGDMALHAGETGLRLSEAAPHVRAAFEVFRERGIEPPMLLNIPPCILPGYEGRILRWSALSRAALDPAAGTVVDPGRYTLRQPGGRSRTLEAATRENRRLPASCSRCVFGGVCLGPERLYVSRFGDSEFVPLDRVPEPFDASWAQDRSGWRRALERPAAGRS